MDPGVSLRCEEAMDFSSLSLTNETGRKRQLADKDGFEKPRKPAKLKDTDKGKEKPVETSNIFNHLREDAAKPGTSKEANPPAQPKPKRIPPIVAKVNKVEATFINAVRAQTSGLVSFEYTQGGLKIRTSVEADHKAVVTYLRGRGVEFFTFNPNPIHQVRYVLRGLPPSMECNEIIAGLREKGVEVSYARQLKRNVTIDGVRTVTLLPMWVITVTKNPENIAKLTGLTGILNFVIRIRDFKQKGNQAIQCFRCQGFGHKADFCNINDKCVKCAGNHSSRTCDKDAALPAKCVNCNGDHSASYQGCPEAKKYLERRGVTRAPQQPQTQRRPNVASNREFPELPRRQRVEQPTPTPAGGSDSVSDFKEILNLFTSGTIRSYLDKFKNLVGRVKQQPDSMSKMMTFCFGLCEIFD